MKATRHSAHPPPHPTPGRMQVQQCMTANPLCIAPHESVGAAYDLMSDQGVRRLPVVDRGGELLGIVTLSDILQLPPARLRLPHAEEAAAEHDATLPLDQIAVRSVMSWDPITVAPGDPIRRAAERMIEHQISGLPVVEGGQVVGILTESDLFRLLAAAF